MGHILTFFVAKENDQHHCFKWRSFHINKDLVQCSVVEHLLQVCKVVGLIPGYVIPKMQEIVPVTEMAPLFVAQQ